MLINDIAVLLLGREKEKEQEVRKGNWICMRCSKRVTLQRSCCVFAVWKRIAADERKKKKKNIEFFSKFAVLTFKSKNLEPTWNFAKWANLWFRFFFYSNRFQLVIFAFYFSLAEIILNDFFIFFYYPN